MTEFSTPAKYEIGEKETILTNFFEEADVRPDNTLFSIPEGDEWKPLTSRAFREKVVAVAKGLIALGIEQGDRVVLVSTTRFEWNLVDFAIWAAGGVTVPIYPSSSFSQFEWIVENSGAKIGVTETDEHTEMMNRLLPGGDAEATTNLKAVFEIDNGGLEEIIKAGEEAGITDEEQEKRVAATSSSDLASIVYTSGTTGRPKGCELTHFNMLSEVKALITHPIGSFAAPGHHVLMFLPLAHVLARAVSHVLIVAGVNQSHWSDMSTLQPQFAKQKPELILGVPRVFEKVYNAATAQAKEGGKLKVAIFNQAEKTAIEYSKALDEEGGPSAVLKAKHALFDKLVYGKLRSAVGGEVKYCITGGSPIGQELLHFFRGVGIPIYEGYGLTETMAAATVEYDEAKVGTVGRPIGGVGVRIAEDGEIQFKGNVVFRAYWKNEEATKESFTEDGWFKSGDLGSLDDEGYLSITGRKKDILVTAGGKNVSPGPLEDLLRNHSLISQAMVIGDNRRFIAALITIDEETIVRWLKDRGLSTDTPMSELANNDQLKAEIQKAIDQANDSVSHSEAIKKFTILDRDFTEEDGEMTPTLKVKRPVVLDHFGDVVEEIYKK